MILRRSVGQTQTIRLHLWRPRLRRPRVERRKTRGEGNQPNGEVFPSAYQVVVLCLLWPCRLHAELRLEWAPTMTANLVFSFPLVLRVVWHRAGEGGRKDGVCQWLQHRRITLAGHVGERRPFPCLTRILGRQRPAAHTEGLRFTGNLEGRETSNPFVRVVHMTWLLACCIGCTTPHASAPYREPTSFPAHLSPPQCGVDLEALAPLARLQSLETLQTCVWLEPGDARAIIDRFYAAQLETTADPATVNAEWAAALRTLGDEGAANTKWQAAVDAGFAAGDPDAVVHHAHTLITAGRCEAAQALLARPSLAKHEGAAEARERRCAAAVLQREPPDEISDPQPGRGWPLLIAPGGPVPARPSSRR